MANVIAIFTYLLVVFVFSDAAILIFMKYYNMQLSILLE